eukprot:Pgem_evm3s11
MDHNCKSTLLKLIVFMKTNPQLFAAYYSRNYTTWDEFCTSRGEGENNGLKVLNSIHSRCSFST